MSCLSYALLGLLVGAQAEAAEQLLPQVAFKEKCHGLLSGIAMQVISGGPLLSPDQFACGFKECRDLKGFHDEVLKALRSGGPESRSVALDYLARYAACARMADGRKNRDEGRDAFRLALGRQAAGIRSSLERVVQAGTGKDALNAACALLALAPDNPPAVRIVARHIRAGKADRRAKACQLAGQIRLTQPEVTAALAAALSERQEEVRTAAAEALRVMGPAAGDAVPALISLLERGKDAWGEDSPLFAPSRRCNLALLALAEVGPAARPAVAVLARRLPGADAEDKIALLRCLGVLGPVAKAASPAIRACLADADGGVRLHAAAALLCAGTEDPTAVALLTKALQSRRKEERSQAVEVCAELGPKSPALVPVLAGLLKDEDGQRVKDAAEALGKMGPAAADAVEALAAVLNGPDRKTRGDVQESAALALAAIGKAGVRFLILAAGGGDPCPHEGKKGATSDEPALLALFRRTTGLSLVNSMRRAHAIKALGQCREHQAEVTPVLLSALNDPAVCAEAATALGRLRPADPRVKAALVAALHRPPAPHPDLEVREFFGKVAPENQMMMRWALARLPR
jgi:hypothetical protein